MLAERNQGRSLLDIGAGGLRTAVPLSEAFRPYVAIEQDSERADDLQRAGLAAIARPFPTPINELFDVVLSSHSLPNGDGEQVIEFARRAWDCVASCGVLCLITFRSTHAGLNWLKHELLNAQATVDPAFESLMEEMSLWGDLSIERIHSWINASTAIEVVHFLSGWLASGGRLTEEYEQRFERIVQMRFFANGNFVFPIVHDFIMCRKA